ncbi:hypothetical protein AUJ17_04120 [Candidatus Micrarchaeota archaeon CG1_02_47_40]|nr:MAG: hypothetical protein AUJ17_04120 [Candidatus Micrarchaeota archaeon CG1_02_47_40]QBM01422.1 hypothetical protein [uncultured archaeon]
MKNPFDKKGKEEREKKGAAPANAPGRKTEGPIIYADSQEAEPPSGEGSEAQNTHKKLKKFSLEPEGIMKTVKGRK